ncbi:hypothetical protein EPN29_13540 [bacterium]|nr:MAG: hypothetical protein EPN29_13540 [bacterium]
MRTAVIAVIAFLLGVALTIGVQRGSPQQLLRLSASGTIPSPPPTAPPFPVAMPGYREADQGSGSIRVFSGIGNVLPSFPHTMNGCGTGVTLVRWRSLRGPVVVRLAYSPETVLTSSPEITGDHGLTRMDNCAQPIFFAPANFKAGAGAIYSDVPIEYTVWWPTP